MISRLGSDLSLLSGGEDHGVLAGCHFYLAGNGFGALGAWIDVVTCAILPVLGICCATTKVRNMEIKGVRGTGTWKMLRILEFLLDYFFFCGGSEDTWFVCTLVGLTMASPVFQRSNAVSTFPGRAGGWATITDSWGCKKNIINVHVTYNEMSKDGDSPKRDRQKTPENRK